MQNTKSESRREFEKWITTILDLKWEINTNVRILFNSHQVTNDLMRMSP